MIKKIENFIKKRDERKRAKVRAKNDKLRKEGKKVNKGWGMVNSGPGGKTHGSPVDNTYFVAEEQKRIAEDNVKETKNELDES